MKILLNYTTCGSHEQYTGSTDRNANTLKNVFSTIQTNTMGLFRYCLLLKIENLKYYSRIIFKYVNSIVRPNFNENFTKLDNL